MARRPKAKKLTCQSANQSLIVRSQDNRGEVMKVVALFVSLFLSVSLSPTCAQTISPQETPSHIGQTVTVKGIVDVVYTSTAGNTFLNFGGRFPNQTFTGFIPAADAPNFPSVHSFEGKTIRINGRLQLYKGKPEIILHSPSQLVPE